jgi:phage terminase Nu1 subunit (DNA packaging protein)
MTAASEATRKTLQRIPVELHREFPDVPLEQISELVEVLAHRLLVAARFDNFVPLLAHRLARERLATRKERRP